MYSCACSLRSNRMDLHSVPTCECFAEIRFDSLAVGELYTLIVCVRASVCE